MLKWEEKNLSLQKKLMAEHRATIAKDEPERKPEREKRPLTHPIKELPPREAHTHKDSKLSKREPRAKKAVKEEEGYGTELYNWNLPTKRKADLKLVVPDSLKAVMVDDWEAVTRKGQVSSARF
jgi:mortality factor 4-like protein 1